MNIYDNAVSVMTSLLSIQKLVIALRQSGNIDGSQSLNILHEVELVRESINSIIESKISEQPPIPEREKLHEEDNAVLCEIEGYLLGQTLKHNTPNELAEQLRNIIDQYGE